MYELREFVRRPLNAMILIVGLGLIAVLLAPLVRGTTPTSAAGNDAATPATFDPVAATGQLKAQPYAVTGQIAEALVCECGSVVERDQQLEGTVASPTEARWTLTDETETIESVLHGDQLQTQRGSAGVETASASVSAPSHPGSVLRAPAATDIASQTDPVDEPVDGVAARRVTLTIAPASITAIVTDRFSRELDGSDVSQIQVERATLDVWVSATAPHVVLRERADVFVVMPRLKGKGKGTYSRTFDLRFTAHGQPVTVPASPTGAEAVDPGGAQDDPTLEGDETTDIAPADDPNFSGGWSAG